MSAHRIDLLFENAVFHTCEREDEQFRCLGVRGGRICWLGDTPPRDAKIKRRVDLGGLHAYPALTDAHLHLLFTIVQAASDAQICKIGESGVEPRDLAGVERRVREIAARTAKGQIIAATNYIISAMAEKRLPTRQELDRWTDGAPVVVYSIDGHSAALSSEMLRRVGLEPELHSGILTGWEHESMQGKITDAIAAGVRPATLAKGLANFANACASFGIARVCALDGAAGVEKDPMMGLLVFLARRMPLEARLYPEYMSLARVEPLLKYMRRPRVGGCGEWEMDGSVGSHSAALSEPYADTGAAADCYYSAGDLNKTVREAHARGWQIAAHAIGDRAIARIQAAFSHAQAEEGPRAGAPHRIEHFEFPSRDSVEQLKQSPVAITVQPGYSWIDKRYLHSYEHFLCPEAIARQVPLAELVHAGVTVCGSSDSPVQSIDPYAQMLGMVDFYLPEQSLSAYEAFCSYCAAPARALGEQDEWGTLAPGKRADFFTTETDIFACRGAQIAQVRAQDLYLEGRAYRRRKGTVAELLCLLFQKPKLL